MIFFWWFAFLHGFIPPVELFNEPLPGLDKNESGIVLLNTLIAYNYTLNILKKQAFFTIILQYFKIFC